MEHEGSLRERLIDVGVELVRADGVASLGLREIARRAGVSHGAPRRYFPTHHSLLSAIARRGFADLEARVTSAIGGTASPRGQVQALARMYVGYARECRGMFELMFRHDLLDGEQHGSDQARLREATLPLFNVLVGLVARCRADADTPPAVTAAALWSNLHGIVQLWAWGSLGLALDAPDAPDVPGGEDLDLLVTAALDAHLGRASS